MAYSDQTEFVRAFAYSADVSTPLVVAATGVKIKVKGLIIANDSGAVDTVTIGNFDGSVVYGTVRIGSNVTFNWRTPFQSDDGLSVSAVGAVNVSVFYFSD